MKHLKNYKLFESTDLPYEEISNVEYNRQTTGEGDHNYDIYADDEEYNYDDVKFINDHWVPFTQSELSKIRELIPGADFRKVIDTDCDDARIEDKESNLVIIKLKDEWYNTMIHVDKSYKFNRFFRCDQFEGLLKFIQDHI